LNIYSEIDKQAIRISKNEAERKSKRIHLYASGTIAKLRNAEYALNNLIALNEKKVAYDNSTSSFQNIP
jgi:hypothetical protein